MVCGDELDQVCPNALDHGTTRHVINAKTFVKRLWRQLFENLNADCEILGIYGSRGALLEVTLSSHGVPANCTIPEFLNTFDMKLLYTTGFVQSRNLYYSLPRKH
jgi:hypothetical protein